MATERLQKILARGGYASRRAAEQWIKEGRVRVNGRVVTELGAKADTRKDKVEVDGQRVVAEQLVYVVFHKPRGVVTTMSDPEGRPSVKELLAPIGARVFPVGRLDFATSGVMLATNDGDFAEGLMHPKKAVPKTYVVKVAGVMQPTDLDRWRNGVKLEDGMTLPATAKTIRFEGDKTWFELTIREGKNQQIRRMGEATGFPVMRLARVEFAGVSSEGLRPGEWRPLTREELVTLKKEYGVPKRIFTADEEELRAGPGRGRVQKGHGAKPAAKQGARPATKHATKSARGARPTGDASESRGGPRYGGGSPGRRGYDVREDWGGGAGRGRSSNDRAPRSGQAGQAGQGDAPGRGSSGGRFERTSEAPRGDVGGRSGRSRTTGTGGGIGARTGEGSGSDYRVRGRSGRSGRAPSSSPSSSRRHGK